jgi:hypothetical protein
MHKPSSIIIRQKIKRNAFKGVGNEKAEKRG